MPCTDATNSSARWATALRSIWRSPRNSEPWLPGTTLGEVASEDCVEKAVNYLLVYETVREQMRVTQRTIERVAMNIIDALYEAFPQMRHVKCTVSKLAPPLGGKLDRVSVVLEK